MASASGRRGRRKLGWATVLCFGSRGAHGREAVASASRARRRRTVPVDGELVARPADFEEEEDAGKGPRARGWCCFLPPRCVPAERQEDGTMESGSGGTNMNRKRQHEHAKQQRARPQDDQNPPCSQAPVTREVQTRGATGSVVEARAPVRLPTTPRDAGTETEASARGCCTTSAGGGHGTKTMAGGVGAFGPAVGLSVVAAVSMAGLLGGRLWAVACVCAWLVALSRLHHRRLCAQVSAAGSEVTLKR